MNAVVHCLRAPYDIYVGRGNDPHTGEPGRLGNPFSHRPTRVPGIVLVASLDEAIRRHRHHLWDLIRSGELPVEELAAMHGKVFGCWCAPHPCHAETIAAAARWAWQELRTPSLLG